MARELTPVIPLAGSKIQTKSIYLGSDTIVRATLDIENDQITGVDNLTFELSADGGSNWEEVTNHIEHVFTNTGSDLRLRITNSGEAEIAIENSDGESFPISVTYEFN